ncbi:MAG: type II secretion system protein, partial [Patescibacteria group bacterium]
MVYDLRFMRKRKGFTLIESMVLVVIFAIAVMTFYKSYILMMEYSLETKHRVASVEFASAELEVLRNTPYEDIYLDSGTTPSPPTGSVIGASAGTGLSYSKIVTVNGTTHRVLTEIYYVDDADDGLGTSNDDNIN